MKAILSNTQVVLIALLIGSCSTSQDTITANIYHNTMAHYNSYYYAREKIREIENTIYKNTNENYNRIPLLYPKLDTSLTSTYEDSAKETIKMAYISIKRHPNSKWLYHNYIMVGLARLYLHDFKSSIQTFKYINTKSNRIDIRHTALLHLVHTLIVNQEYENAKQVIHVLEKERLSKQNIKKLQLEKAYYYQMLKDYNSMAQNLLSVAGSLTKKNNKGRVFLITAQVCQKIGRYTEAHNYYKKCMKLNPIYKIDLYAQLGFLQTTPLKDKKTALKIGAKLDKILNDKKNVNFKDKVYYEIAEFEQKQGYLQKALNNYEKATQAEGSDLVKAYAFLRLGQINFDSLEEYAKAKTHYDRAVSLLPKDIEHYERIKSRQKSLGRLIKYRDIITWQDSLLSMVKMDTAQLRQQLKIAIENRAAEEEKQKAQEEQQSLVASNPSPVSSESVPGWYFENPTLVSLGKLTFERIWGNIPLEDNWRRSNKTTTIPVEKDKSVIQSKQPAAKTTPLIDGKDEIHNIISQLPTTQYEQEDALTKIEDAYFKIGDVFQFELNKKEDAIKSYLTITNRFSTSERMPEVLYKLYLINKSLKSDKENIYYQKLISTYPNSDFTKSILDSTYLTKKQIITKTQEEIYKAAYEDFEHGRIRNASQKVNEAMQLGVTNFTPYLELLDILIIGQTEGLNEYTRSMETFLKKHPKSILSPYVKKLLATAETLQKTEGKNTMHYIRSTKEPCCLAFTYLHGDTILHNLSKTLNEIIQKYPKSNRPYSSNVVLNEQYMINFVCEVPNFDEAFKLFDRLNAKTTLSKIYAMHPFYIFIITKSNLNTLRKTKALEEYMAFFDRNYKDLIK